MTAKRKATPVVTKLPYRRVIAVTDAPHRLRQLHLDCGHTVTRRANADSAIPKRSACEQCHAAATQSSPNTLR